MIGHERRVSHVCMLVMFVSLSARFAPAAVKLERILEHMAVPRGIAVVLGDPTCQLAFDLARKSELVVYVQLPDRDDVDRARRAAEATGLDGTRFQIDHGELTHLHTADNLADLLIAVGDATKVPRAEVLRVLRPQARAYLGNKEIVKPSPDGVDDWSHPYHGPDNNPQSQDRVIVAPYLTQFLANPRYAPTPQVAVASAGRVFKAFGNVAWHEREEPFLNTLVAFNGYNGTILWKRKLTEGVMVERNTMIASPEVLYVADDKSCKLVDAATGRLKGEVAPPEDIAGGTFWKWMALADGVLYALIGHQEPKEPLVRLERREHGGVSFELTTGRLARGFGRTLLAIDPQTKEVLWHYREEESADARAACMRNGRIFLFRFGAFLTCVDAGTGKVIWRKTRDNDPELFQTIGSDLNRQSWRSNWRTVTYLKCSDRALYFAGPQVGKLLAVSVEDGRILWRHPYDNFQLVLRDDGLYAISGPWGRNVSKRFDPLTGEVLANLPVGRRGCTRPTGTRDGVLFRALGGSIRFDPVSCAPRWISPMRPPCQDGVTVANGLLYWWPYACDCQLTLYGVTSLGPAGAFDFTPVVEAHRLQRGTGDPNQVTPLAQSAADWPTFRANNQGTTVTEAVVADSAKPLWETRPKTATVSRPTAPVAVGGLVLLAGSDGVVRCLEAATGEERWKVYTGGEIRLPPTIWEGRALVGSGDGWVYAFEATTGRQLWRFRAAPVERKIPVYDSLLSTWPAASGIVIEDGIAYVAAGIVNYDGTYVYALDAATGQLKWVNDTSGHLDAEANTGVSVQGHMLIHEGKLYLAGGNAMSPAVYDIRNGKCLNDAGPLAKCESTSSRGWELFLVGDRVIACGRPYYAHPDDEVHDHTVRKKVLHASTRRRDIVWLDNRKLMGFDPIDPDALTGCVTDEKIRRHITQAWGKFKIEQKPLWEHDCKGSVAVAVCRNAAVVAGESDVVALNLKDGKLLWSQPLPTAPVPWGLAIDCDGRTTLTLVDGRVVCFQ